MYIQIRELTIRCSLILGLLYGTSCSTSAPQSQSIHAQSKQNEQPSETRVHDRETTIEFDRLRAKGSQGHSDINLSALEPGEVCVINANEAEAEQLDEFALARGYTKKKRRALTSLGFVMSILNVPPEQTVQQGIIALREAFPSQIIDANHHYYLQGPAEQMDPRRYGYQLTGWTEQSMSCTNSDLSIGMIDTTIDKDQLPIRNRIQENSFLSANTPKAQHHHGTAIATLLVGQAESMSHALLPSASLFVAEAFRKTNAGNTEATTWSIVRALDWLIEKEVQIINLSLGGPSNALLTYAIQKTLERGIPIIAAGGNTGPQGRPTYPAAQPGVIAVTALDAELHPYQHASRGAYVAFSAPGVDIWIPHGNGNGVFKSGTSFATPFVTAAAAAIKHSNPHWTPDQIVHQLANSAVDLGVAGKDDTFGWGLIQVPPTCQTLPAFIETQSPDPAP